MSTLKGLLCIFFILVLFFLSFSKQSLAVSISIAGGNTHIKSTDEYSVHVTVSIKVADGTQYYLRGAFAKQGSKKYCGYTWNGTDWFNGPYTNEGWKHLLPITIKNNSWSGDLKAKPDTDNKDCKDPGIYVFKIERFKSSDKGIFDTSSEQTITIDFPVSPVPTSQSKETVVYHSEEKPSQNAFTSPTEQIVTTIPTTITTSISDSATTQQSNSVSDSTTNVSPSSLAMQITATGGASVLGTQSATTLPSVFPTLFQKKKITKVQGISQQTFPIYIALGGMTLFLASGIISFLVWKK